MRTVPTAMLSATVMATVLSVGATAVAAPADRSTAAIAGAQAAAQTPSPDQLDYIRSLDPAALAEIEQAIAARDSGTPSTRAFPIAAAAIAAAAWCAKGALASVPTSVIDDVADGGRGTPYVRNAIIGCLGGGVVWKVLPGWVKKKAVEMVAASIIRYIR